MAIAVSRAETKRLTREAKWDGLGRPQANLLMDGKRRVGRVKDDWRFSAYAGEWMQLTTYYNGNAR